MIDHHPYSAYRSPYPFRTDTGQRVIIIPATEVLDQAYQILSFMDHHEYDLIGMFHHMVMLAIASGGWINIIEKYEYFEGEAMSVVLEDLSVSNTFVGEGSSQQDYETIEKLYVHCFPLLCVRLYHHLYVPICQNELQKRGIDTWIRDYGLEHVFVQRQLDGLKDELVEEIEQCFIDVSIFRDQLWIRFADHPLFSVFNQQTRSVMDPTHASGYHSI